MQPYGTYNSMKLVNFEETVFSPHHIFCAFHFKTLLGQLTLGIYDPLKKAFFLGGVPENF